jgi:hypothetical protein
MIVVPLAIQAVQAWTRLPGVLSAALHRADSIELAAGGLLRAG